LSTETHISGIAMHRPFSTDVIVAIKALRGCLDSETRALIRRHSVWCTEETLVRFLIARDWHAEAAAKLLKEALRWRDIRKPDWILSDPSSDIARRFAKEAETGKIRVTGMDRYGRAVMVFDNSAENTTDDDWHMNFVAWNTMLATRTMAPARDKICLVLQLDRFSMRNQPPLWVTRESITMLTKGFPETLGTCVLYQPPAAFMHLYNMVKYLVDPKPRSKFHFIKGDCSPGTANHAKLCYLIGDNWQELTGCGLKPLERRYSEFHGREIACTPGFIRDRYWSDVLARERAWAEAHQGSLQSCEEEAAKPARIQGGAPPEKPGKPLLASGFCGVFSVAVAGMLLSALTMNLSTASLWLGTGVAL